MARRYSIDSEKNFILIIAIIFLLLTFFVIKDILALIIYSLILSYFLYPVYEFFLEKIKNKRLSSLLALLSGTFVIFIPLAFLSYFLILSIIKILVQYKVYIQNPEILNEITANFIEKFSNSTTLSSIDFSEFVQPVVLYIIDLSKNFFSSIPKTIVYFFIILFISYYILIHNKKMLSAMNEYIPLTLRKQNEILRNITKNLKVLFKGYFLTGLIQTAIALIGYIIFGVPNLLIVTALTFIVSLVPYIGTPLVWAPISLYMILTGDSFAGIGLLVYGTFIISFVDNFVRPILMSDKETISPPLVFIGFVGGLIAFGIEGIILGPIIISITSILLRYLKEVYELKEEEN